MFEVDLLPGAQGAGTGAGKGKPGKRRSGVRARTLRETLLNGWILASCLMVLGSLGVSIRLALGMSQRITRLDTTLREALQDSARAAEHLHTRMQFERKRDSLAARVTLIEEIDARRYDWPHLLEEVAVALPEGMWIKRISDVTSDRPRIRFRVEGETLDNLGLTRLWNALEASFFVRNVELVSTEHNPVSTDPNPLQDPGPEGDVANPYHFVIEADWEDPPNDILDFIPLEEIGT